MTNGYKFNIRLAHEIVDFEKKLIYRTAGSYGIIASDNNNNCYKITEIGIDLDDYEVETNEQIERNNLIETIMFKFFLNSEPNQNQNLIQANDFYYLVHEQISNIIFNIQIIQDKHKWFNNPKGTILFNKMKLYPYNLSKFINRHNLEYTRKNFKIIASQLLIGLNNLHSNNLLHGDLKTVNILCTTKTDDLEQFVITDFGGVKPIGTYEYNKTCTLTYRAPEELFFEFDLDCDSNSGLNASSNANTSSNANSNLKKLFTYNFSNDIWSLGIIFLELLIGYNPVADLYNNYRLNYNNTKSIEKKICIKLKDFEHINLSEKIHDIYTNKKYTEEEKYNILYYMDIVKKMLKVNPNERYQTLEEIYYDLNSEKIKNFKKTFNYNYPNIDNEFFLTFRKYYYERIIQLCEKLNLVDNIPFVIDLLDRFFSKYKIIDLQDLNGYDLEYIGLSIIFLCLIWTRAETPTFEQLNKKINLNINFFDFKICLLQIILFLNHDIYRPFINISDNIKILEKSRYIINNFIIGITPEYYI